MEKTQKSEQKTPQKLAEEAAEKKERLERLDPMTTSQIEHENTQMINDLYRLLKKYQGLRNLIRELKVSLIDAVGERIKLQVKKSVLFFFIVRVRQFQDVSHIPTLHYAQRHDKRCNARSKVSHLMLHK
jgi:predicted nuclease with TOPRIM domain